MINDEGDRERPAFLIAMKNIIICLAREPSGQHRAVSFADIFLSFMVQVLELRILGFDPSSHIVQEYRNDISVLVNQIIITGSSEFVAS